MTYIKYKVLAILIMFCGTITSATENNIQSQIGKSLDNVNWETLCPAISYQDVAYGDHPEQVYDIYLPSGTTGPAKVIILIHGGGWVAGDKSGLTTMVERIMELHPEYAIVNTNYRLANETQYAFPDQFNDIGLLIEHLTLLKESYNITPEFGLIGKSAGGHLSLMYDVLFDDTDQVKFICNLAGPTNFNDPAFINHPMYEERYELLVDPDVYSPDSALNMLSPIYHIGYYNSPTLIFHGNKDRIVPVSNAEDYSEKLKRNQIENKLTLFEGTHFADWTPQNWQTVENKIGEYLNHFLPLID